jgi:hypothetical protein
MEGLVDKFCGSGVVEFEILRGHEVEAIRERKLGECGDMVEKEFME